MNILELERKLVDIDFVLNCKEFQENEKMTFNSFEECRSFLILYLLQECISGVNCPNKELLDTYFELEKSVQNNLEILYSNLPIHHLERLQKGWCPKKIKFFLEDNTCYIIPQKNSNPAT